MTRLLRSLERVFELQDVRLLCLAGSGAPRRSALLPCARCIPALAVGGFATGSASRAGPVTG